MSLLVLNAEHHGASKNVINGKRAKVNFDPFSNQPLWFRWIWIFDRRRFAGSIPSDGNFFVLFFSLPSLKDDKKDLKLVSYSTRPYVLRAHVFLYVKAPAQKPKLVE
uniref:Uncharacterized protein n=1 Tax=Cacopsylla melanoneura TaxID=428564 RepID=A0A8D8W8P6_9HEMI